jgi:hypothetical protein
LAQKIGSNHGTTFRTNLFLPPASWFFSWQILKANLFQDPRSALWNGEAKGFMFFYHVLPERFFCDTGVPVGDQPLVGEQRNRFSTGGVGGLSAKSNARRNLRILARVSGASSASANHRTNLSLASWR